MCAMRSSRIRLVAIDLDGTALDGEMRIGRAAAACIREARGRGVGVTLASGRPFPSLRPYAEELNLRLPLVCLNGAELRDPLTGEVLERRSIPSGTAVPVVSHLIGEGLAPRVYVDDVLYLSQLAPEIEEFLRACGIECRRVGDLTGFLAAGPGGHGYGGPEMIVVHGRPARMAALAHEIRTRWGGSVSCRRANEHVADIVSRGTSKGRALRSLSARLGIPAASVMAIGDGANDLDMVIWAGLGVAVGNATGELRSRADWVCRGERDEGVAEALRTFVLTEAIPHEAIPPPL